MWNVTKFNNCLQAQSTDNSTFLSAYQNAHDKENLLWANTSTTIVFTWHASLFVWNLIFYVYMTLNLWSVAGTRSKEIYVGRFSVNWKCDIYGTYLRYFERFTKFRVTFQSKSPWRATLQHHSVSHCWSTLNRRVVAISFLVLAVWKWDTVLPCNSGLLTCVFLSCVPTKDNYIESIMLRTLDIIKKENRLNACYFYRFVS